MLCAVLCIVLAVLCIVLAVLGRVPLRALPGWMLRGLLVMVRMLALLAVLRVLSSCREVSVMLCVLGAKSG